MDNIRMSSLRERLKKEGSITRKVTSESIIHTADVESQYPSVGKPTFSLKNVDNQIHKFTDFADTEGFHAGFKKVLMEVDVDQFNTIVSFHAIIEIFHVPAAYLVGAQPFKLGSADLGGELVMPEGSEEPKWKTNMKAICLYTEADADKLPPILLEKGIGPAAVITGVIQTLLGSHEGIRILGLEEYNVLETEGAPSQERPYNPYKDNPFAPKKPWSSLDPGSHEYYEFIQNPLDIKWGTPAEFREKKPVVLEGFGK